MSPPWIQASTTTNTSGCGFKAGPLLLLPVVLQLARSFPANREILPLKLGAPSSAPALADNAHRIVQGVLASLPRRLLRWLCSKVLGLDNDIAASTVEFLKSKETLWQILNRRGASSSRESTPSDEQRLVSSQAGAVPEQGRLLELSPTNLPAANPLEPMLMGWSDFMRTSHTMPQSNPLDLWVDEGLDAGTAFNQSSPPTRHQVSLQSAVRRRRLLKEHAD